MKALHTIAFILVIIGGINWLLVGFGYNPVELLGAAIARIVYILVGLSAITLIFTHKKSCKDCSTEASAPVAPQM